jgi:uncharacterized membrane protein YdbT with pleckstrin-like domain
METSDEMIIYRTGVHWIVLFVPVLIFVFIGGIGIFFIAGAIQGLLLKDSIDVGTFIFCGLVYLLPSGFVLWRGIRQMRSAKFALTEKRVMLDSGSGVFKRRTAEVPLEEIRTIQVYQNGFAYLFFDFGTVTVAGTKGETPSFRCVSHAFEFRRKVQEQKERLTASSQPD